MSAEPIYFGDPGASVFGWLHRPDPHRSVRGGVVIAGPVGREVLPSYSILRLLAERLAEKGFLVVRFDYLGTGNSCGDLHVPDLVDHWIVGVERAEALLRGEGASWTAFVGLRLGALLAAAASQRRPIAALVAWEPYRTGNDFLREQHSLQLIKFGESGTEVGTEAVDIPGYLVPPQVAAAVRRLGSSRLETGGAGRVLVMLPHAAPAQRHWNAMTAAGRIEVEVAGEADDEMFTAGRASEATLARVVRWLVDRCGDTRGTPDPEAEARPDPVPTAASTVVGMTADGPIIEVASIIGPNGLFGIETCPPGGAPSPCVVFLSTGIDHSIGPSREWVTLGRRLAGLGYRSMRFDISGVGDSPARPGRPGRQPYAPEAIDDVGDVVATLRHEHRPRAPIVLAGLCSGGYTAIESALRHTVDGVVAVNPVLDARIDDAPDAAPGLSRAAMVPKRRLTSTLRRSARLRDVQHALPPRFWTLIDATGVQRYPARAFARLVERGVRTKVTCGIEEAKPFLVRSAPLLERLGRSPLFEFSVLTDLDHVLLAHRPRERFEAHIEEYVLRCYPQAGTHSPPGRRPAERRGDDG